MSVKRNVTAPRGRSAIAKKACHPRSSRAGVASLPPHDHVWLDAAQCIRFAPGGIDQGGRTMWVRVATFEGGDAEKVDKLMQERMSSGEMTPPEGMSSVLVLDDKDAGKRKFLAFFDSRETLEAAEAGFEQQGDTIPEEIRGKRTSVHYYDVVIFEGGVDGAKAARVSLLEGSPESIDAGLDKTRGDTLPKVRAIDGNVGAIGLADRDNGRT